MPYVTSRSPLSLHALQPCAIVCFCAGWSFVLKRHSVCLLQELHRKEGEYKKGAEDYRQRYKQVTWP